MIQSAEELLLDIDSIASEYDSYEYGLPIRVDIAECYQPVFDSMLSLIRSRDKAIVEACKDGIMRGSFLSNDSPEYLWAKSVCKLLDSVLLEISG
jgi:hypothetical protein